MLKPFGSRSEGAGLRALGVVTASRGVRRTLQACWVVALVPLTGCPVVPPILTEPDAGSGGQPQAGSEAHPQAGSGAGAGQGGSGGATQLEPDAGVGMDAGAPSPDAGYEPDDDADGGVVENQDAGNGQLDAERMAELGKRLFEDTNLSASGTQACASCHSESLAFSGNHHDDPLFPVARGAFDDLFGNRNSPTAMYLATAPAFGFAVEPYDPAETGIEEALTPTGGLFWDGRVDTLAQQAAGPFLNPREMAMPDKQSVIAKVRQSDYASLFCEVFGARALDDVEQAYADMTTAIAAYETTDVFSPFSSKFDAYLRGTAQLDATEQLGFELYKDPEKGNCLSCHAGDATSSEPGAWLFTDFTYDNLGVPRNTQIADNDDPQFFDLGLCQQANLLSRIPEAVADKDAFAHSLCGAFKVPTLRNVARTAPYMHNGKFATLREVVEFYVTRDTHPERWYPVDAEGHVHKFDDLPVAYHANVNTGEAPYDRTLGEEPRLNPDEIDAVVAFLRTLSDGYVPEGY